MPKRSSNKARIQQKADEAAAAGEKKTTKKKTAKKKVVRKKASRKPAVAARKQIVVWKVFNANFKEVAVFSYLDKAKAYKMAEDLEKKDKGTHFVNAVNVDAPIEE